MGYSYTMFGILLVVIMISGLECYGMYRHMPPGNQPDPCVEEIKSLINLARILDEEEKSKPTSFNPEDLIMKLVNALVVTSTQNRCPADSGYGNRARGQRDGLINLDLLNPNNPNNVAQLDLGRQTVAGIGIGDTTNGVIGGALKDLI